MAAQRHKSCRPRSTCRADRTPFITAALGRAASESGPLGRWAALLRSEAGPGRSWSGTTTFRLRDCCMQSSRMALVGFSLLTLGAASAWSGLDGRFPIVWMIIGDDQGHSILDRMHSSRTIEEAPPERSGTVAGNDYTARLCWAAQDWRDHGSSNWARSAADAAGGSGSAGPR